MPQVLRILDANANRAREALRVMEEAARFILADADLTGQLKGLRHDLRGALAASPAADAAWAWRDTPGDVGTAIRTDAEGRRVCAAGVAVAAGKRLSEALRALEEYAKLLDPPSPPPADAPASPSPLAPRIEALRYRAYDLEHRLNLALAGGRVRQWRLCIVLTASLCPAGDWLAVARAALDGGADCLQLREKSIDAGELLRRTQALVNLCRPRGVAAIINDRPDIALAGGADGVHLGQDDLPCAHARRLAGGQLLIGVSTANLDQARRAKRDGADYCGVGPMFPTTTKHKDTLAGPSSLRQYLDWGGLPHLAIGGIDAENIHTLVATGARGVAVSSHVCAAADPADACRQLLRRFPGPLAAAGVLSSDAANAKEAPDE